MLTHAPGIQLVHADCLEWLKEQPDNIVESIVTDPPAGISFMGKDWDGDKGGRDQWVAWMTEVARECLRVLKPGGHALVWALPRTSHWTATAWENAGFEVRDRIAHAFGSGFPKSLNVSRVIDKAAGATRTEKIGVKPGHEDFVGRDHIKSLRESGVLSGEGGYTRPWMFDPQKVENSHYDFAPATEAAKKWDGWGTALKPAVEDWWLLRKPLSEPTIASNVLKHGTGAMNIDGCRVAGRERTDYGLKTSTRSMGSVYGAPSPSADFDSTKGRWPAHLIHDGSEEVQSVFPTVKPSRKGKSRASKAPGEGWGMTATGAEYEDSGSASRFFYCAKPSKKDRDEGLEDMDEAVCDPYAEHRGRRMPEGSDRFDGKPARKGRNTHPTVKSTELMRYLCRLITPPGGTVLDPFMGSGSTGKAAVLEGFGFIGVEQEAEYFDIAIKRIQST